MFILTGVQERFGSGRGGMIKKWQDGERYEVQSRLIEDSLDDVSHSLDKLLAAMAQSGEGALYLCGTRLDHRFCFGSEDLGLALSTLPADASKAAEPGYHPGSTEIYVVFQGSLCIEMLREDAVEAGHYGQYQVLEIPPGTCHRVRNQPDHQAASLIVKTNLRHQPGVVRCAQCDYYDSPMDCQLARSWREEQESLAQAVD